MKRQALTLVELLVVITILVVLLAALAPVFRAGLEERKLAEATRGLSGAIMKAKALAAETNRPVGIAFERLDSTVPLINPINALQSTDIYIVEIPIPYSGDMDDATCFLRDMNHGAGPDGQWGVAGVDDDGNGTADDPGERGAPGSDDGDGMPETATFSSVLGSAGASVLINPGDLIRFNFRGPLYRVVSKNTSLFAPDTDIVFTHDETVWGNGANGVFNNGVYGSDDVWISPPAPQAAFRESRFQVYRAPVRTLAQPYRMPTGFSIDLSVSGLGNAGAHFGADPVLANAPYTSILSSPTVYAQPLVIMFTPSGEVDAIYLGGTRLRPQQSIHLLVGPTELVNPANPADLATTRENLIAFDDANADGQRQSTEDVQSTLMSGNRSSWVSIGHRSGLVTVSENDTIVLNQALAPALKILDAITQSRASAIESQTYGGR